MGTLKIDGKLSVGLNNSDSMACGYGLHVHDLRNATITPNSFGDQAVNYYFDEEVNGDWKGIMHFKGWSGSYAAWQIAAQASNSADNTNSLYFRTGINNTWNNWHTLLDNYNYTSYTVTKTGSGASGTWGINVNGNAATSSRLLNTYYISGDNHSLALKAAFDTYKDSIPRNELSTYYSSAYGNGSMYMGYFLSGYDSTPYGGFYVAHYDTPYYVGIQYGSYNQQTILTSSNYATWCAPASHSHSYLPLSGGTLTGNLTMDLTKTIILRAAEAWRAGIGYDTQGNECIALWAKNTSTRLRWYAGTDMSTMAANTMMGITPDFEISKASGTATGYIGGNTILHSGNIASNGVVMKRDRGYAYTALSSCYTAGSTPTYYRIILPDNQVGIWNMVTMEITVRQSYDSGTGGKIIINAYHSSGDWTGFTAYVDGYMTHNIKVYGSGGKYFYISGCGAWSTLSLDKMIISDGAVTVDLTNTTCDYVASIPSGYSTATMSYGLTSTNYSSYTVPISGGTMTGKLQVNNLIFSYNYTNSSNAASFMLDKPGSHYTGIGANGSNSTIKFGPCNADGTWVSDFDQHWVFQGTIRPGCIVLTNDQWIGYGSADPNDAGLDKVEGRLYFKV